MLLERGDAARRVAGLRRPRAAPHGRRPQLLGWALHGAARRSRDPRSSLALALCRSPRWRTGRPAGLLIGVARARSAIAALAVPVILLGFDGFFLRFHEVFFSGDTLALLGRRTRCCASIRRCSGRTRRSSPPRSSSRRRSSSRSPPAGGCAGSAPAPRSARVIELAPSGRAACCGSGIAAPPPSRPRTRCASFRAAVEAGVDLIEFDVLDLRAARSCSPTRTTSTRSATEPRRGRVRDLSLEELREVAPELPTLDEALAFFVDEAPEVGLHVDLKLRTRLDELGARDRAPRARGAHGRQRRPRRRACGPSRAPRRGVRIGITYPEDRLSISRKPYLWPIVSLGLTSMRASVPLRLPRLARRAGASAVMLQHRLVTRAVGRARARRGPAGAGLDGRRAGRPRRASSRPASTA